MAQAVRSSGILFRVVRLHHMDVLIKPKFEKIKNGRQDHRFQNLYLLTIAMNEKGRKPGTCLLMYFDDFMLVILWDQSKGSRTNISVGKWYQQKMILWTKVIFFFSFSFHCSQIYPLLLKFIQCAKVLKNKHFNQQSLSGLGLKYGHS